MGDYDNTLGFMLLGTFINTFLLGLVSYQFAVYFASKFNDPLWLKLMVVSLLITDFFHSGSLIYLCWYYVVTNYANPGVLTHAYWPLPFTGVLTSIAAMITHVFLSWRYYSLTKNVYIYVFLLCAATTSMALGFTTGIRCWQLGEFVLFLEVVGVITGWLVCQAALDIIIAALLSWTFFMSRTGFHRTDDVLKRLIRGSIQTGLLAALWSIGDLVGFLVSPESWIYFFFATCIGRMYTNTLMDTLNCRRSLKVAISGTRDIETNDAYQLQATTTQSGPIRIKTVTETVIDAQELNKDLQHIHRDRDSEPDDNKFAAFSVH
ncbi:hypothetical protein CPB85DRAFT_1437761 [Mucidula mucida]|nr:hypothetical protein CPB85DRAFT_1437761 [Mucidula mucida]